MNGTDLALRDENAAVLEDLITKGDLDKLTAEARARYYVLTCESLGLNPLTKPFEYLRLQGNRLTLYATRTATDQLRARHGVSIRIVDRRREDDLYVVTAQATLPDGRQDEATGAVTISGQRGEALANALMKAETKAKRRVTLSVCGLGWMDETEAGTVPGAQRVDVDASTGEVLAPPPPARDRGVADKARRRIDAEVRPIHAVEVERTYRPAAPVQTQTRLERLEARYITLLQEAREFEIDTIPLPENADESTLTDLGVSLREQIEEARKARAAG